MSSRWASSLNRSTSMPARKAIATRASTANPLSTRWVPGASASAMPGMIAVLWRDRESAARMRGGRDARMKHWAWIVLALAGAGCATMTPEQKMVHELFVEAAGKCETRYHTIHVDQIGLDGSLQIHADAESRGE